MLGAIIGDIVGSVYEFNNTKNPNFRMLTPSSIYTDDSIMTCAVAEWAMFDPRHSMHALEECMLSYAKEFPYPAGGYGGGFRTWLFQPEALNGYADTERNRYDAALQDEFTGVRRPYNSYGNGSAMRVSSIGWLFDTLEETERMAIRSAYITHNHIEGLKGAAAVAAAIFLARNGGSKKEIESYIKRKFYGPEYFPKDFETLYRTYKWDSSCQGTVPQAILCFLESHDYESAIRNAIIIGGDSDTVACITGAIAEAYYKHIPEYLVRAALKLLPQRMLSLLEKFRNTSYKECFDRYISPCVDVREFTNPKIKHLAQNEIFVFGSNLEGHHGGGAAYLAFKKFGAQWGVGVGMTGQCYAIPTMHGGVRVIKPYVDEFIRYASRNPQYKFLVTRIGCGIAGFTDEEIAPLFAGALPLKNVVLPYSFYEVISSRV